MTVDAIHWPDELSALEVEHIIGAAEDQQVADELAKASHGEALALRREVPAGIPGRPSCNPRSRVAADCGSQRAAAGESAGADDPVAAIAVPDMTAQYSDDMRFVDREVRIAEERNIAIEAAMYTAQEAGNHDAYDAACEAFDAAYHELVTLEGRMLELEDREARAEERSLRGWAQWATR